MKVLKRENGFTLLEMILVLAMFVTLIGLTMIYIKPYNERNAAFQIRSEAQLALDTTTSYVNSTSNFKEDKLSEKLEKVLQGYVKSTDTTKKKRFEIQTVNSSGHSELVVRLYVTINDDIRVECTLKPELNSMHLKGIGDAESVNSLVDSGVLDS